MKGLDLQRIGYNIRMTRDRIGYTQGQLGSLIHASTSHISHIENGTTRASLETVYRIANALGTSIDLLILSQYEQPGRALENELLHLFRTFDPDHQAAILWILDYLAKFRDQKRR